MTPPEIAVVGGGIVGLATALALIEEHARTVVVVEAAGSVGEQQTGHNSGVIHSGLYYPPGSLKATLTRSGIELMYRFCEEEGIPHRRCGKLVVAVSDPEVAELDRLEERGRGNGVLLRRVPGPELVEFEPNVAGRTGLWVEDTGVVDFREVARALQRRVQRQGGRFRFDSRVTGIRRDGPGFAIETVGGVVASRMVVACAGLYADRVARLAGIVPGIRVVPFRGEYYQLKQASAHLVRGVVYPVPDPSLPFLGVHLTRGLDDVVEAGPNAVLATKREGYRWRDFAVRDLADWLTFPGFWRMGRRHWRAGIKEIARSLSAERFTRSLQRLVPSIRRNDIERGRTGVRAQAIAPDGNLVDDFLFHERPGALHVLNAPSPGGTAALAIGRAVAARLAAQARW